MIRISKVDPLFWLLGLGFCLYALLEVINPEPESDKVIVVSDQVMTAFMLRQGNLNSNYRWSDLEEKEQQYWRARYIEEEALFREAISLGLDQGDNAIRRRLVQSMKFSLQDVSPIDESVSVSDEVLKNYFQKNLMRYQQSPRVSISHVFFDVKAHGEQGARLMATNTVARNGSLERDEWLSVGDRYPYQRSMPKITSEQLAAEWGKSAAEQIFMTTEKDGQWFGPVRSKLGFHLVRVESRSTSSLPKFDDIRDALQRAYFDEQRQDNLSNTIASIVTHYKVVAESSDDG